MTRARFSLSVGVMGLFLFSGVPFAFAESPCPFAWNASLKMGSRGADVLALQKFLNSDSSTVITTNGAGSPGQESEYFGLLTQKAVARFQEKYRSDILTPAGLSQGTGFVGAGTRARLNSLCASSLPSASRAESVSSENVLTVSTPEQPAPTLAPQSALYVPFTKVTLTAGSEDVDVTKVVVAQAGLANQQAFSYLSLLDEDGSELSYGYFRSDHTVVFPDSFTVPAGESLTLTVAGNMADDLSNYEGQMPALQVNSITASSPVSGNFPIRGTYSSINTNISIGSATATRSSYDPGGDTTNYINDSGVRFAGIRISAGSTEDLHLSSLTWDQTGTAGSHDITSVETVVNGVSYPTEVDGHSYTSTFPKNLIIKKGDSLDVYVEGTLLPSGANRTVKFDIRYNTDVYLTGTTYGYGIYITPGGNTSDTGNAVFITEDGTTDTDSGTPFYSASSVSISGGAVTSIEKAN